MDILASQRLELKNSIHRQYEEWTYLINQSFKMIMYYFPEGKSTKWEAKALFSYMLPNGRDSHNCDKVSNVLSWMLRHFRIFLMFTSWNKTKQNKKSTECDTSRLNKYISSWKKFTQLEFIFNKVGKYIWCSNGPGSDVKKLTFLSLRS